MVKNPAKVQKKNELRNSSYFYFLVLQIAFSIFFFKICLSAYMPTRFCLSSPMVIAFLAPSILHDAYTMPTLAYTILRLYSVLTRIN